MVDSVLFLIYGVTWCIGVTMPLVIFCVYRSLLRMGWVLYNVYYTPCHQIAICRGYSLADVQDEGQIVPV
jgi:hypothetical protein